MRFFEFLEILILLVCSGMFLCGLRDVVFPLSEGYLMDLNFSNQIAKNVLNGTILDIFLGEVDELVLVGSRIAERARRSGSFNLIFFQTLASGNQIFSRRREIFSHGFCCPAIICRRD